MLRTKSIRRAGRWMADQPTDYLGSVMAAGSTLIHSDPALEPWSDAIR
jgi:hypothetical protein